MGADAAADREARDAKPGKIQIAVTFGGRELKFLYSETRPLEKILVRFCEAHHLERREIVFNYNGATVKGDTTAVDTADQFVSLLPALSARFSRPPLQLAMDADAAEMAGDEVPLIEGLVFQEGGAAMDSDAP
ncbi:Rad60-SLD domain-containing protein [Mycena indigotica]|uniref:Rad60-SLD domain-containing protein n=1 Tax=Mycena indigotica TaxID=2126181 RepID=A0A8H6T3E7_9AGAR|nr:Rad60-SLD domain-containing protein [Mycena indigotica]KAF7310268.1 Rad60-SLD domain-containing protein [Mycena indigotica]